MNDLRSGTMRANIRRGERTRVVIVGCGLGGLKLAMGLRHSGFQIVVVDKNNYNQFPPLIYQVASAGLEPSNIAFPIRRLFQGYPHYYFRMAEVKAIDEKEKAIQTSIGTIHYDYLVLGMGATTNFFGNEQIARIAFPMKTVGDAMALRNHILHNLALAEMKKYVVPRDYPDLADRMHIYLVNSGDRLLKAMDKKSSALAEKELTRMGVHVCKGWRVTDYDGRVVRMKDGETIESANVIWVSGVKANTIAGVPDEAVGHAGRLLCDRMNRVKGMTNVFAIGDQSLIEGDAAWPLGHPQLAQVALQQAQNVARNILRKEQGQDMKPFVYKNPGTMATIGRKAAVAEIGRWKFGGLTAWLLWLVVHLRSILGVKNKFFVLLNWMWNYVNYKQSLRLILRAGK